MTLSMQAKTCLLPVAGFAFTSRSKAFFTQMNRSAAIDSKLSLDAGASTHDRCAMITQPYQLYVQRTDRSRNMARYYAMSIEPTLFGDACLVRRWGRIGARGQTMMHHFASEEEAVCLFLDLLRQKKRRGYSPFAAHDQSRTVEGRSGELA